jgi:tetratricopeptide (TPR) repeat protein
MKSFLDAGRECGETHCATLTTRSRYALLLAREGKYALAEEEFWSMLGDETLVNGVRKRVVMNNIGLVLKLQKKYGEAEHIFKHLLKLQEQASDTMPSVQAHHRPPGSNAANSRASIATCLEAQGKTDEAEKYRSNPPLPSTTEDDVEEAKTLHERSLDMLDGGQYNEAEATARKELVIRMEHAGLDDNRTQTCLLQIARALHGQNPHCDSQSLTRQALAYRKRVFGYKNIETQAALKFLAITTLDQGKFEEAEACYRQLVRWLEYTHSKLDVEAVYAREALAEVLRRQRKYPEAEELCRLNLEVELHIPIRSEPRLIVRAYYNLGYALWDQSHNAEAETYFHHAYDRYVELFGRSDADTTNSLVCLAEVVAEQGKSHEAEELYLLLGESVALPQSEDEDSDEEDSDEKDSAEEDSNKEDSVGEDSTKETRTKIRD